MSGIPEVFLQKSEVAELNRLRSSFESLEAIEMALQVSVASNSVAFGGFSDLRKRIAQKWREHDHVVVRELPFCAEGTTGLLVAAACFRELKRYRGGKVVKHFRMSPWTKALSHTLAGGFFHTDLNTSDMPPAATAMQCLERDPGAPGYGQLRVARIRELLLHLDMSYPDGRRFLTHQRVTMMNEMSPLGWEGAMVQGGVIRFHPESLLAAQKHLGRNPPELELHLKKIHEAALEVSMPIDLEPGEMLLVSNRRALHQRGACTVRFRVFPGDYDARRVSVFHAHDEPA
ncbi:TauD/TfdA family dioxygenase [Paraburkholderia sp.]|uniref:TauD/TfdA family dioxygenase n=1 Tax=Paraburkholderia sp. TaxID=1926495 RepID=UPI003C7C4C88